MDELRVSSGTTMATFLPDLGMLGISFRHGGEEVLDLSGGLERYRQGHVTGDVGARAWLRAPVAGRPRPAHWRV